MVHSFVRVHLPQGIINYKGLLEATSDPLWVEKDGAHLVIGNRLDSLQRTPENKIYNYNQYFLLIMILMCADR